MTRSALPLLLLTLGACAGDPESEGKQVPNLELLETVRMGTMDGGEAAFTRVRGILPHDSSILVLEAQPAGLAAFDQAGKRLGSLSRAGDGPGELRSPSLLGRTGGDLWVGDPAGGRLEIYSSDGSPARSVRWTLPPDSLGVPTFPHALLADGAILGGPGFLSIGGGATGRIRHRDWVAVPGDGEDRISLYREVLSPRDFFSASLAGGGGIIGMHPLPESPIVAVYPDGSGLVVVERAEAPGPDEASYRLLVLDPAGAAVADRTIPYLPLSARGWVERRLTELSESPASPDETEPLLAALAEAWSERTFYPPVTAVVAGADGTIWVRREETGGESVAWDLFTREGDPIGRVAAPKGLTILWASTERVWGVETNELDVPFVVRLDVTEVPVAVLPAEERSR